jgi:N-acetylglucosamine-6-sulfatase
VIAAGSVSPSIVLSLDLAPTLLELGGASVADGLHGRSLVPILRDRPWPPCRSFLIEHSSDDVFPRTRQMGYEAVRTERYKLIKYTELVGMDELYDLEADPYEPRNTFETRRTRSVRPGGR